MPLAVSASWLPASSTRPSDITTTRSAEGRYCGRFETNEMKFKNTVNHQVRRGQVVQADKGLTFK